MKTRSKSKPQPTKPAKKAKLKPTIRQRRLQSARRLAHAGFHVLPLQARIEGDPKSGKRPITDNGVKDATADFDTFKGLLPGKELFNVGIATGARSNILVIDVDPRNGGDKTMRKLRKALGDLPDCPVTKTGGGGQHYFLKWPVNAPFNKTKLGPGVDVLGDNSYVVAPPSRHISGKLYQWQKGRALPKTDCPEVPVAWLDAIKEKLDGRVQKVTAAKAIREGARNDTLTRSAGKMRAAGHTIADIEVELLRINRERCQPPLDETEVVRIVQSAATWPSPTANVGDPELAAQRLLDDDFAAGEHLRFERDGSFYAYIGTHWREQDEKLLKKRLMGVIKNHFPAARKRISAVANEALSILETECRREDDALHFASDPPPVINVLNGEIHLLPNGSHKLRPHDPATGCRHVLPITYDKTATCPIYTKTLAAIFSKAQYPKRVIKVWHQLVGYIIQPRRMTPIICLLLGSGGNGKSKLVETIEKLLGSDAVYSGEVAQLESNRFGLGSLVGKLLFIDDDVRAGTQLPDGTLKKLSEQKRITAERKNRDHFDFILRALPVLLCNNPPSLADVSHGIQRRLVVFEFKRRFKGSEEDKTLFPSIWATELPGILNLALAGWHEFVENRFKLSTSIDLTQAKRQMLKQANSLATFVDECCDENPNARIGITQLYKVYVEWAKLSGYRNVIARNTMKGKIEHLDYEIVTTNGASTVVGLALNKNAPRVWETSP